jgi:hypothetical protein
VRTERSSFGAEFLLRHNLYGSIGKDAELLFAGKHGSESELETTAQLTLQGRAGGSPHAGS